MMKANPQLIIHQHGTGVVNARQDVHILEIGDASVRDLVLAVIQMMRGQPRLLYELNRMVHELALEITGTQVEAAALLGMSPRTMTNHKKIYRLTGKQEEPNE